MRAVADWLIARAQKTPYSHLEREDGRIYMRRFWLVPYDYIPSFGPIGCGPVGWNRPIAKILQLAGIAIRIHHIMKPDRDRHMHDHPWWWISIVLRGSYVEITPNPDGAEVWPTTASEPVLGHIRHTGSIAIKRPTDRHKIAVVPPGGVWTLFITGPKRQEWGFYTETGKVHHRQYGGSAHIQHQEHQEESGT